MSLVPNQGTTRGRFVSWLKSVVETKSFSSPDAAFLELCGSVTPTAGISVTPYSAMTCAPVRCAVQAILEAVGQLPVHVYSRSDDGTKAKAPDQPAHKLLHDQANDWTAASDLREQLTRDALLWDNGG